MGQADCPAVLEECRRVRSLRLRSTREATGHHYVEGLRQVFRALDTDTSVELLVYCERLAPTIAQRRVRVAKRDGVHVLRVTPEQFRSVSIASHASGIGAIVNQHWSPLHAAEPTAGLCWIGIGLTRSGGNLGTLLRTAEAVGAAGVIVLDPQTDPFDSRVVRASMGGVFGLRMVRATHSEFSAWAALHRCLVVGTTPSAGVAYTEMGIESPLVVLFGEERRGLTCDELGLCSQLASIPMVGHVDSLNLGVASGVVLFDLLRRRSAIAAGRGHATTPFHRRRRHAPASQER